MAEFKAIEIDFDIHKLIEAERKSFSESPNDALRRLLRLPPRPTSTSDRVAIKGHRSWSGDNVSLPHGTKVRMRYNGRHHEGSIVDGKWVVDGKTFDSPSGAASGVATTKGGKKTRLDGWVYWEVKPPQDPAWTRIGEMRHSTASAEELGL